MNPPLKPLLTTCALALASPLCAQISDGDLDTAYNPSLSNPGTSGWSLLLLDESRGGAEVYLSTYASPIRRVLPNGQVDTGFNPPLSDVDTNTMGSGDLYLDPDPSNPDFLLAWGAFSETPSWAPRYLHRISRATGALDPGFAVPALPSDAGGAWSTFQTDPTPLAGGGWFYSVQWTDWDTYYRAVAGSIASDGTMVQPVSGANTTWCRLAASDLPGGKLLLIGDMEITGNPQGIVRLLPTGLVDTGFIPPAVTSSIPGVSFWGFPYEAMFEPVTGMIYLGANVPEDLSAGGQTGKNLYRLLPEGALDPTYAPIRLPDLPTGYTAGAHLGDFFQDVRTDGSVLVAQQGYAEDVDTGMWTGGCRLTKISTAGQIDTSFNPVLTGGSAFSGWFEAKFDGAEGSVHVSHWGTFDAVNGDPIPAEYSNELRLKPDGTLDTTFTPSPAPGDLSFPLVEGPSWDDPEVLEKAWPDYSQTSDGRWLLYSTYSWFTEVGGQPRTGLARVGTDGTLDEDFAPVLGFPEDVSGFKSVTPHVLADGSLLLIGNFDSVNGVSRPGGVARLHNPSLFLPERAAALGLDPAGDPLADSDKDNALDFLEIAFMLDPLNPDALPLAGPEDDGGLPFITLAGPAGGNRLRIEYLRWKEAWRYNLRYIAEFAASPNGPWTAVETPLLVRPLAGTSEQVVVEDTETTSTAARRFGRVRVVQDPP